MLACRPAGSPWGGDLIVRAVGLTKRYGDKLAVGGLNFEVRPGEAAAIGELAAKRQIVLHELAPVRATLEEAFFEATAGDGGAGSAGEGQR